MNEQHVDDGLTDLNESIVRHSFEADFTAQAAAHEQTVDAEYVQLSGVGNGRGKKKAPNKKLLMALGGIGAVAVVGVLVAGQMGLLAEKPTYRPISVPASLAGSAPTAGKTVNVAAKAPVAPVVEQSAQAPADVNPALAALANAGTNDAGTASPTPAPATPEPTPTPAQSPVVVVTTPAAAAPVQTQKVATPAVVAKAQPADQPAAPSPQITVITPQQARQEAAAVVAVASEPAQQTTPKAKRVVPPKPAAPKVAAAQVVPKKPQQTAVTPSKDLAVQPTASPLNGEAVKPLVKVTAAEIGLQQFGRDTLVVSSPAGKTTIRPNDVLPNGERVQYIDAASLTVVTDRRVIQVTQ